MRLKSDSSCVGSLERDKGSVGVSRMRTARAVWGTAVKALDTVDSKVGNEGSVR